MSTTPRRLVGCGIAVAATLLLTACGDDSESTEAPTTSTTSTPDATSDTPAPSGSGTELNADLDIFGQALQRAIGDTVDGYDIDGSTLRLRLNTNFDQVATECLVVELSAGSLTLPPDPIVEVEYADGHVEVCDV